MATGTGVAGAAEGATAYALGEMGDLSLGESVALGAVTGVVTAAWSTGASSPPGDEAVVRAAFALGLESGPEVLVQVHGPEPLALRVRKLPEG